MYESSRAVNPQLPVSLEISFVLFLNYLRYKELSLSDFF